MQNIGINAIIIKLSLEYVDWSVVFHKEHIYKYKKCLDNELNNILFKLDSEKNKFAICKIIFKKLTKSDDFMNIIYQHDIACSISFAKDILSFNNYRNEIYKLYKNCFNHMQMYYTLIQINENNYLDNILDQVSDENKVYQCIMSFYINIS